MTSSFNKVPKKSYGILFQDKNKSKLDEVVEQVRRIGYAILDSGLTKKELMQLSKAFNSSRETYINKHGESFLKNIDEFNTVRALLTHGDSIFISLATNQNLISVLGKLIVGKFILNQQNGIINPSGKYFNQGLWHRDLPYQHFVSNSPLAINALFCIDDFTLENGSTFVLPGTHKEANFPSKNYVQENALQVVAKAGQFILIDCMLFHSAGFNNSSSERRAINHVYTIPYFKQQIKLPQLMNNFKLDSNHKELFGFNYTEPTSIDEYFNGRIMI